MIYSLADRIQLINIDNRVFFSGDYFTELNGVLPQFVKALQLISEGCELHALQEFLNENELKELLDFLSSNNLLRKNWSNEYIGDIVEKQIYYLDDFSEAPNELQKNLESKTVAVIGVGGVGSVVLQHLIGSGINSYILIDDDEVQKDNLNRQFIYSNSDIGRAKVDAAKDYLFSIRADISVKTYKQMVDSEDSLSILNAHEIDFVINAADQPAHLYKIINTYCTKRNLPWITSGVGRQRGFWGPLVVPKKTICMECFYKSEEEGIDELERELRKRLKPTIQASFGATNTVLSSLMVKDVILYLATNNKKQAYSLGARCSMDFEKMEIFRTEIKQDETCACWNNSTKEDLVNKK